MEKILIRFAGWIFRKYGYYYVATKNEKEIIGDDALIYYTDNYHFHKMMKELKDVRY